MKNKYKISSFLFLALLLTSVTFWACRRTVKDGEILGNNQLKSAPSDFTGIVNSSQPITRVWNPSRLAYHTRTTDDPDYTSIGGIRFGLGIPDRIYFENELSHEVTWFVEFTGRASGAHMLYSGTSKTLDTSLVFWDGTADGTRFFPSDEAVDYTLSFLGSSIKYTGTLNIHPDAGLGPKLYNDRIRILPSGDTLKYKRIDDMEGAGGIKTSYSDQADGAGKARFFITDNNQVSGYFSYYMIATDNNGNGYCGGSSGEALTELHSITKKTDPSKIYFNAYIRGYGRPNSTIFFQAFENDFADPAALSFPQPRENDKNDMWYSIVEVNWVGWKLVSIPYSAFKPANNPASGGGGNRVKEPHKLCGFGIEFSSYPTPGLTVELAIDDVYLTENAPFQP